MKRHFLLSRVYVRIVSISMLLGFGIGFSTPVFAMGQAPKPISEAEDLALSLAVLYAKTNPQYAVVLAALNINTGADVKKFLKGDVNGQNFDSILAFLINNYGQQDPGAQETLDALDLHSYQEIKTFLSSAKRRSSPELDMLLQLAFDYARKDSQYGSWLDALGIKSVDDIAKIFNGKLPINNLQDQMIKIGRAYTGSPEAADLLAGKLFPALKIGTFQGLPIKDIAEISDKG